MCTRRAQCRRPLSCDNEPLDDLCIVLDTDLSSAYSAGILGRQIVTQMVTQSYPLFAVAHVLLLLLEHWFIFIFFFLPLTANADGFLFLLLLLLLLRYEQQ